MPEAVEDREFVPLSIRERGGLALSMWKTGANRTDCLLVAQLVERAEALDDLMDALDGLKVSGDKEGMTAYTEAWLRAHGALIGGPNDA